MPIDLVIDEREGGKGDLGDSNNNANRSTADSTSHTDGASTPDMVSTSCNLPLTILLCLQPQLFPKCQVEGPLVEKSYFPVLKLVEIYFKC